MAFVNLDYLLDDLVEPEPNITIPGQVKTSIHDWKLLITTSSVTAKLRLVQAVGLVMKKCRLIDYNSKIKTFFETTSKSTTAIKIFQVK